MHQVRRSATDITADISAEIATHLQDGNEDDLHVDTDPFASDEEFEDDKTVVDE